MTDSDLHLEQLHERVLKLRSRGRQLPDRYLLVAGGVLLPLGLVLIVIGWYGSAQTTLDFEQTPYLISGGILGLALVFTGGLLYFSFWLTQLVRDGRTEALHTRAHQERVELALERIAAGATARPQAVSLVVTAGGTMLHRPECAATDGQVTRKPGNSTRGLTLCGLCRPEPPAYAKARA